MEWQDEGVCVQLRRLGESKFCAVFFTRENGLHRGVVRHNRRAPLQVGTVCELTWKARLCEHMGTWTRVEVLENTAVHILDSAAKALSLASACELLTKLMPERQAHELMYLGLVAFLQELQTTGWLNVYAHLEALLLKDIGFGMEWGMCAVTKRCDGLHYISPVTGNAVTQEGACGYEDRLLQYPHTTPEKLAVFLGLFSRYYERYFPRSVFPFVRTSLQDSI
ncbi:MAG: DNA repair protein RecO [Alphaproteobacteria bacterium]|nr:MAG: DNA repair protein RecO [Alphaproteobacteria bacterium]